MASLLSNLVNNLAEGTHTIKCNYGYDSNKCETCRVKYKDYESAVMNTQNLKMF